MHLCVVLPDTGRPGTRLLHKATGRHPLRLLPRHDNVNYELQAGAIAHSRLVHRKGRKPLLFVRDMDKHHLCQELAPLVPTELTSGIDVRAM